MTASLDVDLLPEDVARFGTDPAHMFVTNHRNVQEHIASACHRCGRRLGDERLLPVTKTLLPITRAFGKALDAAAPISTHQLYRVVVESAGTDKRVGPHRLRHSLATRLLEDVSITEYWPREAIRLADRGQYHVHTIAEAELRRRGA